MCIDVCRGGEGTVTQPDLDLLHGDTVAEKQAGAGVTKIMEAHPAQAVALQEFWECRSQIISPHPLAQLVHKHKAIILVIVTVAADLLIEFLLPSKQF